MNIETVSLYAVYVVLAVLDLLAAYFKVLDAVQASSAFFLIVGHFLGLQVATPIVNKKVEVVPIVASDNLI